MTAIASRLRAVTAVATALLVLLATIAVDLPAGLGRAGRAADVFSVAPWSTAAAREAAEDLFVQGQREAAARAAKAALSQAPLDQRSLAILALSSRPDRATTRMGMAAALGWRDRRTQLWIAQAALRLGRPDLFAQRYGAFLRQSNGLTSTDAALDRLLRNPAIFRAMLPDLRQASELRRIHLLLPPRRSADLLLRAATLHMLMRAGAQFSDHELQPTIAALRHAKLGGEAYALWRGAITGPSSPDEDLLALAQLDQAPAAPADQHYVWHMPLSAAGSVAADRQGGLTIESYAGGLPSRPLLQAELPLPAGRLDLRWKGRGISARPERTTLLAWSVDCDGRSLDIVPVIEDAQGGHATVQVAQTCSNGRISLLSAAMGTNDTPGHLHNVQLVSQPTTLEKN